MKTYSYEESVVGTWVDGKPIYRKCFPFTHSVNVEWKTEMKITNANIVKIYGVAYAATDNSVIPLPEASTLSDNVFEIAYSNTNGVLCRTNGSYLLNSTGIIVIEYTK